MSEMRLLFLLCPDCWAVVVCVTRVSVNIRTFACLLLQGDSRVSKPDLNFLS